jgi:tryptophan synthase beta chain
MSEGKFGIYGGKYIPETLMNSINELEVAYNHFKVDEQFNEKLRFLLNEYAGRPSRLYYAENMTKQFGGAKIYLKREDLNHTGSHKINDVLGQVLLAKKMGKRRIIAETGTGQHGIATASVAALLGMECEIFMGEKDIQQQTLNVFRMQLLGAKVHCVKNGARTLKDAISETMRECSRSIKDTFYVLSSAIGPHPYPQIVRDFQSVISKEIKRQLFEKESKLPSVVVACIGGGSNALGAFYNFINDKAVCLIGCESAGKGIDTFETAAVITKGKLGILHGMKSYFCQTENGQIIPTCSISTGLNYPGIGPEHAYLYDTKRVQYVPVDDNEAIEAFEFLSKTEGIIPAIESAHALYYAMKIAPKMKKDEIIVVCISGTGDKDVIIVDKYKKGLDINE